MTRTDRNALATFEAMTNAMRTAMTVLRASRLGGPVCRGLGESGVPLTGADGDLGSVSRAVSLAEAGRRGRVRLRPSGAASPI